MKKTSSILSAVLALLALFLPRCSKVGLDYTPARFDVAQGVWFEGEETFFLFWNVGSPLGLGPESVVEVSWASDEGNVAWTAPQSLSQVHRHEAVSCGAGRFCGSASPKLTREPRSVLIRVRYHRDGEVAMTIKPETYVIKKGNAFQNRSFVVYGVFDETNTFVQWRGRHVFPALRNEEATALGLRRAFEISDQSVGDIKNISGSNPYNYGTDVRCPQDFVPAQVDELLQTSDRAIFNRRAILPAAASNDSVCALAKVNDATGDFIATAWARKNPETRSAFDTLRSPVKTTTPIGFVLLPCRRSISLSHLEMQKQRLLLNNPTQICTDDFSQASFKDQLVGQFQQRISNTRAAGNDMTLSIAVHHDDLTGVLVRKLEDALAAVLPDERARVTPRVTGAFVFDSLQHIVVDTRIKNLVLWCPAAWLDPSVNPLLPPDESQRACPVLPDNLQLNVGPVRFSSLPILPSRQAWDDFVARFSESNAGRMTSLDALAPQRTAVSTDIPLGEYGWVTFFNNEQVTATSAEAFSYCGIDSADSTRIYFRTTAASDRALPLSSLPASHAGRPVPSYELGLAWDFPFLLRLGYETFLAGSANAVVATVPFGLSFSQQQSYGNSGWTQQEFKVAGALSQCTRFCSHPFFDESGVYNVRESWRIALMTSCYRPRFPRSSDGGFPVDP
ncbi:hypothetical protein EBR21_10120 [bacterium]|nr:hypothetical protein [bacterium]